MIADVLKSSQGSQPADVVLELLAWTIHTDRRQDRSGQQRQLRRAEHPQRNLRALVEAPRVLDPAFACHIRQYMITRQAPVDTPVMAVRPGCRFEGEETSRFQ